MPEGATKACEGVSLSLCGWRSSFVSFVVVFLMAGSSLTDLHQSSLVSFGWLAG